MIGEQNKCSVPINLLDPRNHRFAGSSLENKLMNVVDEMPRINIKNIEAFKNATGGAGFEVEKKGKDAHFITNNAKCIFSANETGEVDQKIAESFFSRIIPLECVNVFSPDDKSTKH